MVGDSEAAFEDSPAGSRRGDTNLRRLDDHRQTGGISRPADLVWAERRRFPQPRFVRLHEDPL